MSFPTFNGTTKYFQNVYEAAPQQHTTSKNVEQILTLILAWIMDILGLKVYPITPVKGAAPLTLFRLRGGSKVPAAPKMPSKLRKSKKNSKKQLQI